jgi:hypothetical protein
MRIRKEMSGGASGRDADGKPWSHHWDEDGAVIEVPHAVATELLNHPGWDYSEVLDEPDNSSEGDGDSEDESDGERAEEPGPGGDHDIEEPAPEAELSEAPRKAAARKAPAKKTGADGK